MKDPDRSRRSIPRWRHFLIYLLVAVLCSAALTYAHGSTIRDNWHVTQWEDSMFFRYNSEKVHGLLDCFEKNGAWMGLYRPLTTNLYYYAFCGVFGDRVEPYHAVNVVFVVLNALLLYRFAEGFLGEWWAMLPAVLFASRYALIEVVLHTCEFQGLLYVFLTLLSLDLFVRSRQSGSSKALIFSAFAFFIALLSKESAVVVPALLVVYGWLFDDSISHRDYLVHPIIAVAWATLFLAMTRGQSTGFVYDFSLFNVARNYAAYFLVFSNWLLTPAYDAIMPPPIAALSGTWFVRLTFVLLVVGEFALLLFRRRLKSDAIRVVVFGFAWFLITTLPFAIFQGRLFMRYAYLGHVGLALCAGALLKAMFSTIVGGVRTPTLASSGS